MNFKLIKMLSDGEFHSGVALGRLLGLTRAAVWKQIIQLNESGLKIESVKGKGYRLLDSVSMLDAENIREQLLFSFPGRLRAINILESVNSTNDYLKAQLCSLQVGSGDLCVAEQQTSGRGRRGRDWVSPFAQNIYLSLSYKLSGGFASLSGLSLAIGVVIAEVLETVSGIGPSLKWPNDILTDSKKLAGILIDVEGEQNGPVAVVIGVGINVEMIEPPSDAIGQPWTSIVLAGGRKGCREELCIKVVAAMLDCIAQFELEGFSSFMDRWHKYDGYIGKEVVLQGFQDSIRGRYLGVDALGGVMVKVGDGSPRTFNAGELSLREAECES